MSRLMTKPTKWHVCPAKIQISLGIRPVWSESLLSAWRKLGSLATHCVPNEGSDQTGWMPRLIWVFAGRTYHFVGFVMWRLKWTRIEESTRHKRVKYNVTGWSMVSDASGLILESGSCHSQTLSWQNQQNHLCGQRRLRSAWGSAVAQW